LSPLPVYLRPVQPKADAASNPKCNSASIDGMAE